MTTETEKLGLLKTLATQDKKIKTLRAQVAQYGSRLESIATIAHYGGLAGMTEGDALVAIRRLTLPMQNRSASFADTRAAIDKARTA